MRIEMWSDVICPICGLTQHRLRHAVAEFEHGDEVELIHRSFQVHPDLSSQGITQTQLSLDAGMTIEQMDRILRPLELAAEAEGFGTYRALDRTLGSTALTHELLAYATEQGRHDEAWAGMFQAHFGAGRQLWTLEQLVEFAPEIGLDAGAAREVLESRRMRRVVEAEQVRAVQLGARGTPFILIDGRYAISGGADTPALVGVMHRVWAESRPAPLVMPLGDGGGGEVCGIDGCAS
jgi:predicted DsbA family dithiol-disulfide isomerase